MKYMLAKQIGHMNGDEYRQETMVGASFEDTGRIPRQESTATARERLELIPSGLEEAWTSNQTLCYDEEIYTQSSGTV